MIYILDSNIIKSILFNTQQQYVSSFQQELKEKTALAKNDVYITWAIENEFKSNCT